MKKGDQEERYRRTMETYFRWQTNRLRLTYFDFYLHFFFFLATVAAGIFAYNYPGIVEDWWGELSNYLNRF